VLAEELEKPLVQHVRVDVDDLHFSLFNAAS
jgi:hypothetical protein